MANDETYYICDNCLVVCVRKAQPAIAVRGRPGPPPTRWVHPPEALARWPRASCDHPTSAQNRRAKRSEIARMRGALTRKDSWFIRGQLAGLDAPAGRRVELAAVGYVEEGPEVPPLAWGYLSSSGHFGLGANKVPRRVGGEEDLGAEGRGLFWGTQHLFPLERNRVTIITDIPELADLINAWRAGRTDVMPPGYKIRHPDSGRPPKLVILAADIAAHRDLVDVQLVEEYADTPLGTGANELATHAWAWATGAIDKPEARKRGLAIAADTLGVPRVLAPAQRDQQWDADDEGEEDDEDLD